VEDMPITGRAHHRSSPHGCGFVYALPGDVFLHFFSSSPSRQQQAPYLAIITQQSGAGMLHAGVSRHARITPTIKPHGACRRLTNMRGG